MIVNFANKIKKTIRVERMSRKGRFMSRTGILQSKKSILEDFFIAVVENK